MPGPRQSLDPGAGPVPTEVVELRVPADSGYARVVRVAVSAFATPYALPPAALQDLRLAVDEALVLLLTPEVAADDEAVVVTLEGPADPEAGAGRLAVHLRRVPEGPGAVDAHAVSRFHELIPPGVVVLEADPAGGVVALARDL